MKKTFIIFLLSFTHKGIASAESSLSLYWNGHKKTWSYSELKSHSQIQTVLLPKDPSRNGQATSYLALATADLFSMSDFKKTENRTVEVIASDGMSVSLDLERLTNKDPKKSIAYLAVKPVGRPWHDFKPGEKTGPYFLFWLNPKLSNVGVEEWPFQVTTFRVQKSIEETYPLIVPDSQLGSEHPVQKGFRTFVKNCFVCHTFNKQGASRFGPDLNYPYSPVNYFKESYLHKYIRNPRQLRDWPDSRMPAFGPKKLSNLELQQLLEYFKYMAKNRPQL